MKPLNYFEQIRKMPNKADKFDLRLRIVKHAIAYGVKPTARVFDTTAKTVRKWLRRYQQERLAGLHELPRIPLHCPHKTSSALERKIVNLRKDYPFMGAKRLKYMHNLPCSHEAISRILREHGLVRKKRKKHKRKKDLSKIKKHWRLFGQFTVDTKHLNDIPHYWPQMKVLGLPKYQFTAREVRSGLMYLGFSKDNTAANACLFGRILCEHLRQCGLDMKKLKFQTDNGHEFIGCFRQDRTRDGFERVVEAFGSRAGTLHRVNAVLPYLWLFSGTQKAMILYQYLLSWIARDKLPDRPNRIEPRAVKRRPKEYALLNKPRSEMREALLQ